MRRTSIMRSLFPDTLFSYLVPYALSILGIMGLTGLIHLLRRLKP